MAEVTEQETNNQVVERFCRFLLDFSPGAGPEDADDADDGGGGGKRPYAAQLPPTQHPCVVLPTEGAKADIRRDTRQHRAPWHPSGALACTLR